MPYGSPFSVSAALRAASSVTAGKTTRALLDAALGDSSGVLPIGLPAGLRYRGVRLAFATTASAGITAQVLALRYPQQGSGGNNTDVLVETFLTLTLTPGTGTTIAGWASSPAAGLVDCDAIAISAVDTRYADLLTALNATSPSVHTPADNGRAELFIPDCGTVQALGIAIVGGASTDNRVLWEPMT
jgi:hypothetical protein